MKKYIFLSALLAFFNSTVYAQVTISKARRIEVTNTLDQNPQQEAMDIVTPYMASVDSIVKPILGKSRIVMTSGRPESTLSNWAADAICEDARRYFGKKADMGLVNVGGLRNNMPEGTVRVGDIMLISPFQNFLTMVQLRGDALLELMQNIASVGGEGVSSQVRMVLDSHGNLQSVTLSGKEIEPDKVYRICTIDYLAEGNDRMVALKKAVSKKVLKTTFRDALMGNIMRHGVITSQLDGRIRIQKDPEEQVVEKHESRQLLVVHTNDTHSCIDPISPNYGDTTQADKGGYMRRATLVSQLRQDNPQGFLLLDNGDFSQGSVYYNLFRGEVEVKLMNQMKYDAATIGNHEFDYGLENMARLFQMAQFPIVCCNYDFTGTPVQGLTKPYIIIERAGVKVGILGVAPQLDGLVSHANYGDTRYTDPVSAAQPIVDFLRNVEKVDVVICMSHLGWLEDGDIRFVAQTRGIDLVLGGHSHTYFDEPRYVPNLDGKKIPVNQMGKNARFVGTLLLEVE